MLQILTDLLKVNRMDYTASAWILASGVQGNFVEIDGSDGVQEPSAAGNMAYAIWTESYRDGTAGNWTGDVSKTGKVTILFGKYKGLTDQFTGTPAVGEKLYATTAGKLSTTAGAGHLIGICTKSSHSVTYLGTAFTAIEFVTV